MSANPYPISFQVGIKPISPDLPKPDKISFDTPCTEHFNRVQEGFVSLGMVPDHEALDNTVLEPATETTLIKKAGQLEILVPESLKLLIPFVSLVSSYEKAHSDRFFDKEAAIIVRDVAYKGYEPSGVLHRDPPNIQRGGIQNAYSFASTQPTNFTHDRTPDPYEIACFTPGAVHWRPDIWIPNGQESVRRLFVVVAFDYKPEVANGEFAHSINWHVNRQQILGRTL